VQMIAVEHDREAIGGRIAATLGKLSASIIR
jgi:hypothetical protein